MNHTEDFKTRNKKNIAENKCKQYLKDNNILFTRYGFDCLFDIKKEKFNLVPEVLRPTPDFMVFQSNAILLEAKGCKEVLRVKQCDMKGYDWWAKIIPLTMFLYSTIYRAHKIIPYKKLRNIAVKCETDIYHDNNKVYYKIPWELI